MRLLKRDILFLCLLMRSFRGTNTAERIAGIIRDTKEHKGLIKHLVFGGNTRCRAHITSRGKYDNYHFQEEVTDDEVRL